MNSADWVARYFANHGINKVFLYPGGTIAPLVNACLEHDIAAEVFKNEQGAVYAALAYARITGKPQVAMVTSGPGVTNAITPLADAYYDSTPLVLITGQIGTADLNTRKAVRQRGFQEVPTIAITTPITKRSRCMFTPEDVIKEIPAAFQLAVSGRPGPAVIDFPMDIQRAEIAQLPDIQPMTLSPSRDHAAPIDDSTVSQIAAVASAARRPVLLLGHGALTAGAFQKYADIASMMDARVVTSLLGIGSYDTSNDRWLGYVGHTGHLAANRAVYECDFLLALGTRLDVRQTGTLVDQFVPNGQVAWINSDLDELTNPRVDANWGIHADVASFCEVFANQFERRSQEIDAAWAVSLSVLRHVYKEDRPAEGIVAVQPRPVLQALSSRMKSGKASTVVTGVGCHQHWAARHLAYHPENCRLLTSGGHGTMGYDLPSAVGAAMAEPDRRVLCVVGDGSFMMNIQEMAALRERDLDVKILVFNNRRLGIVSQFQLITWGTDPTTGSFGVPDLVMISRGFGIPAEQLEQPDDVEQKLDWLWAQEGPALLNILIDPTADVVPMLLAGQTMGEMWMGRRTT